MKKHILFFLCMALVLAGKESQAQFRIFGGPQYTSAKYTINNAKQEAKEKQGFMAGIGLTTQIEGPLYFAPSVYFSRKGYDVTFNPPAVLYDSSSAKNINTTINTIVLEPLFQLNFSKSRSHFFFRFGPAVDFAINGKEVFDSTNNKRIERDMLFGSTGYSSVTFAGNLHLGYEHKSGFTVFAHYSHGLSSQNNADMGPIILHRILGLSVGWKLGKK